MWWNVSCLWWRTCTWNINSNTAPRAALFILHNIILQQLHRTRLVLVDFPFCAVWVWSHFVSDMLKLSAPLYKSAPWRWDFPSCMQLLMGCAHSRTETCCHTYEEQLSVSWWVTAEMWRAEPWPAPCWCHTLNIVALVRFVWMFVLLCCVRVKWLPEATAATSKGEAGVPVMCFLFWTQCLRELGTRSVFWFSPLSHEDCVKNKQQHGCASQMTTSSFSYWTGVRLQNRHDNSRSPGRQEKMPVGVIGVNGVLGNVKYKLTWVVAPSLYRTRAVKMQHTSCTEDRIQHALDRCLDGLRQSPTSAHNWNGKTAGDGGWTRGRVQLFVVLAFLWPLWQN